MGPATEGVLSVFAEWMSQGLNEHSQASSGRWLSVSTPHTHPSEWEDHISPVSNGFCRILEDGGHRGCFRHLRSLLLVRTMSSSSLYSKSIHQSYNPTQIKQLHSRFSNSAPVVVLQTIKHIENRLSTFDPSVIKLASYKE